MRSRTHEDAIGKGIARLRHQALSNDHTRELRSDRVRVVLLDVLGCNIGIMHHRKGTRVLYWSYVERKHALCAYIRRKMKTK